MTGVAGRAVVAGCIVRVPLAGMAWHYLQYVLGLRALGYDVWYIEDSDDDPWCCYDPSTGTTGADPTYGLAFAGRLFDEVGLGDRWAYFDAHGGGWCGPAASTAAATSAAADVFVNVSETSPVRAWFESVPVRILIDTDPAFTQVRHLTDPARRARADAHTHFWTFAGNIGALGCTVPDDGYPWQPTGQPVVTSAWPAVPMPEGARFSTVMQWDSYPAREYSGQRFGMKSESFEPYLGVPARVGERIDLAVGSPGAPRSRLSAAGWNVLDPEPLTASSEAYRSFIQRSAGEFSVAKAGYVTTRSGWFSERSCAYLASGRPVVLQDTGFSDWLPTGDGLVAFADPEGALEALRVVRSRVTHHADAARQVAVAHFEATQVLGTLPAAAARL